MAAGAGRDVHRRRRRCIAWSGDGPGRRVATRSTACSGRGSRAARGATRDRPVLLNNWEGDLLRLRPRPDRRASRGEAEGLGVELFVLDDGWFGARDDDDSSAWATGSSTGASCPAGSTALAREVHGLGLQFGLWIEPEMVNADSDLFRAHPDWAIGVPGPPADGEPRSSWCSTSRSRRSSTTSPTR